MLGALKFLTVGPRALVKRHCSQLWSSLLIHIRRKNWRWRVQGERRVGLGFYAPFIRFPFWVFGFLWSVFFWYLLILFLLSSCWPFPASRVFTLLIFIFCFRSCLPFSFLFSVLRFLIRIFGVLLTCTQQQQQINTSKEWVFQRSGVSAISMSHLDHAIGTIA